MYFRTYATVRATDPDQTVSAYGSNSDLRCLDAHPLPPPSMRELLQAVTAVLDKYLRLQR